MSFLCGAALRLLTGLCFVTTAALAVPGTAGAGPMAPRLSGEGGLLAGPLANDRVAPPAFTVPLDDWSADAPTSDQEGGEDPTELGEPGEPTAEPSPPSDPDAPLPTVRYGTADLPPAVARMREALVAAAGTGDPARLADLANEGGDPPLFSSVAGGDPLDLLLAQSGDPEGREILAIMLDVLDAGWVSVETAPGRTKFVWPYFAQMPADRLTPPQMVELFRIITAGDFDEMRNAGTYVFYRVEIDQDGRWLTFLAGE